MKKEQSKIDYQDSVEFESIFGKGIAVQSETIDREFARTQEGDLFIIVGPKNKSVQYFTPSFEIDLEPIYHKLKQADSDADWFLHQSHHMILCGASSAPQFTPTKLSFEQLIEAAKAI